MLMSAKAVYALARGVGLTHDQAVTATAIARAESGWDPEAVGDISLQTATWGPSVGLWQIRSLKAQRGTGGVRDASHLSDPTFNARSMHAISDGGHSWGPWSTYTNGAYLKHVAGVRKAVGDGSHTPQGKAPRGTTAPAGFHLPDPGDLAGLGSAALPPIGLGVPLLKGGAKDLGEAYSGLLDMLGIRNVVITGAVVFGGVLLVLAGAAATAKGAQGA